MAKKQGKPPRIALRLDPIAWERLHAAIERGRKHNGYLSLSDVVRIALDKWLMEDEAIAERNASVSQ